MGRYETDGTVTCVASWGAPAGRFPVGSRSKLEGKNLVTIVLETGRPARVDDFAHAAGPIGVVGRQSGFHSAVGTPIIVEGRVSGVMTVGTTRAEPPLPAGTEARLEQFTELLASAVANAESRAGSPGWLTSRRHCGASRRWPRLVRLRRRCSLPSSRRSGSCLQSIWRTCAVTTPTVCRRSSRPGADRASASRRAAGGPWGKERRHDRVRDRPSRPNRGLFRCLGAGVPRRPRDRPALGGWHADHRRQPPVGDDRRRLERPRSPCRLIPRRAWRRSLSSWLRRSRTPRAAPSWPGSPNSRRRCVGSRRWLRARRRPRRCSLRLSTRSGSYFRSSRRAWAATSRTVR